MNIMGLSEEFRDEKKALIFIVNYNLIQDNHICPNGNCICHLNVIKNSNFKLDLAFRCPKCKNYISIFQNSLFEDSHIALNKALYLIYFFSQKVGMARAVFESDVSQQSVFKFFKKLRRICFKWTKYHMTQIGGKDDVVQIDESLWSSRKNHEGRIIQQNWIFGGISMKNFQCFVVLVPDRSEYSLIMKIFKYIHVGTTICSDQWKSYSKLENVGYPHETVNHSIQFMNGQINTQKVERFWRK